jgi:hypothetical protein
MFIKTGMIYYHLMYALPLLRAQLGCKNVDCASFSVIAARL